MTRSPRGSSPGPGCSARRKSAGPGRRRGCRVLGHVVVGLLAGCEGDRGGDPVRFHLRRPDLRPCQPDLLQQPLVAAFARGVRAAHDHPHVPRQRHRRPAHQVQIIDRARSGPGQTGGGDPRGAGGHGDGGVQAALGASGLARPPGDAGQGDGGEGEADAGRGTVGPPPVAQRSGQADAAYGEPRRQVRLGPVQQVAADGAARAGVHVVGQGERVRPAALVGPLACHGRTPFYCWAQFMTGCCGLRARWRTRWISSSYSCWNTA